MSDQLFATANPQDRRAQRDPWPGQPPDELESEAREILLAFSHVRRMTHNAHSFDLSISTGRLQTQLRSYVRRLGALVAQALVSHTLDRDAARRAFDACHRLDVTWLQLCELRDETAAMPKVEDDTRHSLDSRLARLADRYASDARLVRALIDGRQLVA